MDDIQKKMIKMVKEHPACLDDRKLLRALLMDCLPQNRLHQNLVLNAYDEEIIEKLKSSFDVTLRANRMIKDLSEDFGLTNDAARWSVLTWCYLLQLDEAAKTIENSGQHESTAKEPLKAQTTGNAKQPFVAEKTQQHQTVNPSGKQILRANTMYVPGTHCPYGNVILETIRLEKALWGFFRIGSNYPYKSSSFIKQTSISIPKGIHLKVSKDVFISSANGITKENHYDLNNRIEEKPEKIRLQADTMYIAGVECPHGHVRFNSVDGKTVICRFYIAGTQTCNVINIIKDNQYIYIPNGTLLNVDKDVYVSKELITNS